MNWKHIVSVLGMGVAGLILAATPVSAQCNISLVRNTAPPPDLNAEGITERGGDIRIQGPSCFAPNQPVTVSFNAVMSAPTTFGLADVGKFWAIAD